MIPDLSSSTEEDLEESESSADSSSSSTASSDDEGGVFDARFDNEEKNTPFDRFLGLIEPIVPSTKVTT